MQPDWLGRPDAYLSKISRLWVDHVPTAAAIWVCCESCWLREIWEAQLALCGLSEDFFHGHDHQEASNHSPVRPFWAG
jgi:hypothetical protein